LKINLLCEDKLKKAYLMRSYGSAFPANGLIFIDL